MLPDTLLDLKIELWRKSDSTLSIHQYLGWTKKDYETWKSTGKTPWIEKIYAISATCEDGSESMKKATDAIFKRVEFARNKGYQKYVNSLLNSINVERLEETLLVAFLMTCIDIRDDLPAWDGLFKRTREAVLARVQDEQALSEIWKNDDSENR